MSVCLTVCVSVGLCWFDKLQSKHGRPAFSVRPTFYMKRCLLLPIFCTSIFTSNGLAGRLLFLAISPATNAYSSGALRNIEWNIH